MLFVALCARAKSSILPTVLAVLLLVVAVAWWRRRSLSLGAVGPALAATAVVAVALVPATGLLAGGSAGSTIGALTALDQTAALQQATALDRVGLISAPVLVTTAVLIGILVAVQFVGVLLAWPLRHDQRAVLLAACVVAGFGAMMVVHHPGGSQLYFMRGVLPLVAVLTARGSTQAARPGRESGMVTWRPVALGGLAGLASWAAVALAGGMQQADRTGLPRLGLAIMSTAGCCAVAAALLRLHPRPGWSQTVMMAAVLAAVLVPSAVSAIRLTVDVVRAPGPDRLSAAQVAATTWLRERTPVTDVVATNVHCSSGPTRAGCDSRAFWVTGLGERRAYVESWGYTDQAQASAKSRTSARYVIYARTPFFDPERLRRNDATFTAPTAENLAALYAAGVRVLLADSTAGPVSPDLAILARPVFDDHGVSIYVLLPPGQPGHTAARRRGLGFDFVTIARGLCCRPGKLKQTATDGTGGLGSRRGASVAGRHRETPMERGRGHPSPSATSGLEGGARNRGRGAVKALTVALPGPSVRVHGLTVSYGGVVALDGVEVGFRPGALTAVTGPSGAGKSSLLWAMAGALTAESVTAGTVEIDGQAIKARRQTLGLGVALLPQDNGLASVLTATENALVPLLELGIPAAEARVRAQEALVAVGLEDSGNHLIEELSGGQQQRVAVARALGVRPRLLLADEPTSELDHTNRERVIALLGQLADAGATVVMATHDLEAASAAVHEISLDAGQVVRRR